MKLANALRVLVPPLVLAAVTGGLIASMIVVAGPPDGGRAPGVLVTALSGPLVAGEGAGMRAGRTELRTVRLTNVADTEVRIAEITAITGDPAGGTDCLPVVALVRPLAEEVTVPARAEVDVRLTVRLSSTVQRACRGLRFPLYYKAVPG